ncbi:hypothetical protein IVA79_03085 [Bradyrhizobium sp. 138]|uniref:hypothetical protein n=1 Tax=Bradyrhizobium sp. 138 TaxID=2782615 RepID=UPI001FFA06CB|nr:hypothetical protein [Bradyrhizobium sp. 138]MCK1732963.1 hypothetical protein [Bradyrhizobium sp. 138]
MAGSAGVKGAKAKKVGKAKKSALLTDVVVVDANSTGSRWTVQDANRLARLIALIAMGQALHAAKIIEDLSPTASAISAKSLTDAAKRQLRIVGTTPEQKDSSRWRRDGFLFEAISWIAARQAGTARIFMKDPHIKATTQGIDGLMIELAASTPEITSATIFEDKCSENPRAIFRGDVMKAFADHHKNLRGPELVSGASALIEKSGVDGTAAVQAASRVLDLAYRRYRAALAISAEHDSETGRVALFKGYNKLKGITAQQRIGATFVVDGDLRDWFDDLAQQALTALDAMAKEGAGV